MTAVTRRLVTRSIAALVLGACALGAALPAAAAEDWRQLDPENVLVIDTTKGRIFVEMDPQAAPLYVERMKLLTRQRFFDGLKWHRVIDGFMAQTGDPTGTGMGGSGTKLKAEFNKGKHQRGTCSMARAGHPDSADSQFFICFGDASFLDGQYTVWGEVTSGMENVDQIKRGEPVKDPDKIVSAKIKG